MTTAILPSLSFRPSSRSVSVTSKQLQRGYPHDIDEPLCPAGATEHFFRNGLNRAVTAACASDGVCRSFERHALICANDALFLDEIPPFPEMIPHV